MNNVQSVRLPLCTENADNRTMKELTTKIDERNTSETGNRTQGWLPLVALSLSVLLSSLGTSIANVALPTLAAEFDAEFPQVQWVVLAYLVASTIALITAGKLADMFGKRQLMAAGIIVFITASVLCGVSPTLWMLIAARAVQGIGAAIMTALALAMVGDAIPKERAGTAMGLLGTMSAVGTALGPAVGGGLITLFGWPAIFFINVPLGMATFVLVLRALKEDRCEAGGARKSFDWQGTAALSVALAAAILALTIGSMVERFAIVILLAVAVVAFLLFAIFERRSPMPIVPARLLRDLDLSSGLVFSILVTAVVMATMVVGPFYLTAAFGINAAEVGMIMAIGPIVSAIVGFPAGRLVDRVGKASGVVAGLAITAAGCLLMVVLPESLGLVRYIGPLIAITAGYATFQAANNAAVMSMASVGERGVISGMLSLSRNLGLIAGASLMAGIFNWASASEAGGKTDAASGLQLTFGIATALMLSALSVVLFRRIHVRRGGAEPVHLSA